MRRLLRPALVLALLSSPIPADPLLPEIGRHLPRVERTLEEILDDLAELPDHWKELEEAFGPLERDPAGDDSFWLRRTFAEGAVEEVNGAFLFDLYHEDPTSDRNPRLRSWRIEFRSGAKEAVARLEARLGPAEVLEHRDGTVRIGDLFLRRWASGSFRLEWHRIEPEWAVPERSPTESAELERRLIELFRHGIRAETLERVFPGLVAKDDCAHERNRFWEVRVCPAGAERPQRIRIIVRGPPLPADRLFASFGWIDPGVVSRDVHFASRDLVDLADPSTQPTFDGYELGAWLDEAQFERVEMDGHGLAWKPSEWRLERLFLQR